MSTAAAIVIAALGSSGLFAFAQFLITRHDNKLLKMLRQCERDSCRTQLLLLMRLFPDREEEIMTVAQHYFEDLKANWYMTDMFVDWCKARDVNLPVWVRRNNHDNS